MPTRLALFTCIVALASATAGHGQGGDSIEVRVFGGAGADEVTAVWVDGMGCVLAGETTSDITMAEGQAMWAPGGPVGRKGFIVALDDSLHHQWSFAFAGDLSAPLGAPSTLAVRDVVRAMDSTAWVLYDAPRNGAWEGHLLGVHPQQGIVGEYDLTSPGAVSTVSLARTGTEEFIIVGERLATAIPESLPSGIMAGWWDAGSNSTPGWAFVQGSEGMHPVGAVFADGLLFVAVHRAAHPEAPAAVAVVSTAGPAPQVMSIAAIADPDLVLTGITSSGSEVAWSGSLTSADATVDATYGKLAATPDSLNPGSWSHDWIVVTESAEDRPARAILWTGDVVQCAARTTTEGAGGSGAMVQRRFGATGAWFGIHVFGGEGDEDVRDMARDQQGRLYVVGSSNSWPEVTGGNGSMDAALFRASSINLNPDFGYGAPEAVLNAEETFVGMEELPGQPGRHAALALPAGAPLPVAIGTAWSLHDASGRRVAHGEGPAPVPSMAGWARLEIREDSGLCSRWIWVSR